MRAPQLISYTVAILMVFLLANCQQNDPKDKQINEFDPSIEDVIPDAPDIQEVVSDSLPATDTISEPETDIEAEAEIPGTEEKDAYQATDETVQVAHNDLEIFPLATIPVHGLIYRYAFKHKRRLASSNYVVFQIEEIKKNKFRVTVLGSFSPYYLPMEKVFTKLDYPWGGSIEFSKQNWPVSFGVGYNAMKAQSSSLAYHLQSNNIYLFSKYTPLKLFNDKLEFFLTAGVTSWAAQISNVKYPEHEDYYPTETNRGYSYYGGVGSLFEFHKFLIGLQYQLYGTPLVVFGADFNEPDNQEDLKDYTPSTQYKLHAGTNQLQIIVGYRIN